MNPCGVRGRGGQSNLVNHDLIKKNRSEENPIDRAMRAFSVADNQCALHTPTDSPHHSIPAQKGNSIAVE